MAKKSGIIQEAEKISFYQKRLEQILKKIEEKVKNFSKNSLGKDGEKAVAAKLIDELAHIDIVNKKLMDKITRSYSKLTEKEQRNAIKENVKFNKKILSIARIDSRITVPMNHPRYHDNKIILSQPTYKHENRWHALKITRTDTLFENVLDKKDEKNPLLEKTENLTGDKLKRKIIENIKTYIENSLNGDKKKSMKEITHEIKNNPAYTQILAKGTGIMTRTFGLETSSKKAVDKMLDEAEEKVNQRPRMK